MQKTPLTPEEVSFILRVQAAAADGLHYDVLGLDPYASRDEVEIAYRERVRHWHPDRFYSRDQGEHEMQIQENFVEFGRAWRALKDDASRAAYDRALAASGRLPPPPSVGVAPTSSVVTQIDQPSSFEVLVNRVGGAMRVAPSTVTAAPAPPRPRAPAAIQRFRQQLAEQLGKAREHYDAGKTEADSGNWGRAENAYYLATRYDPKNTVYEAAYREAAARAKQGRAAHFVLLAEQAESYARHKEAVELLRKAVECDPAEGVAYFRLGKLLRETEDDGRGALEMYRKAVMKEPRNDAWRLALAELYDALGLRQNALREARTLLETDPKNEKAKALVRRLA